MKREHLFSFGWTILIVAMLFSCTTNHNYTTKIEKVYGCDTSELVKLRKELKEKNRTIYWVVRQRDSLRIESHRKDGIIGDTNVFKRMYFDNEGNLIKAI